MFGLPQSNPDGLRIAMADGLGKITMAGPGSAPILGVGRLITMDAGSIRLRMAGAGGRADFANGTSGGPRWLGSSDLAGDLEPGSAASGGFHLRLMSDIILGMDAALTAVIGTAFPTTAT